jgi:hypothetical protein
MTETPPADLLEQLRDFIDREVRGGFTPVGEIPGYGVACLADDASADALRPYAEQYTADALVALAEAEKAWPARTDCDRLDDALARLESAGILARQNFSCCQNCGHGEMWDLVQESLTAGGAVRGYTFYHQQDTEAVVGGDGLCLAWGATEPGDPALAAIGQEVAAALRGEGLRVDWDGTVARRISVAMDWQRRRE